MKKYKSIDDWKNKILKNHKTAEFNNYDYTISAFVREGEIIKKAVGFICKGNLKGLVHSA